MSCREFKECGRFSITLLNISREQVGYRTYGFFRSRAVSGVLTLRTPMKPGAATGAVPKGRSLVV